MPKLIKDGKLQENPWKTLEQDRLDDAELSSGNYLVPLDAWLALPPAERETIGLWIGGDTNPSALSSALAKAPAIAIRFAGFADGRGFSLARILREDCDFGGELQAAGNFMQDQLFYLKRCGFNAFDIADDADIDAMLVSLQDFSNSYQASHDEPRPLFRRR
ncbi:MAG TPA: DUF934 domain-containing protein [Marinagarivorans sp.]